MKLVAWGGADLGRTRKINEDAFLLDTEHHLVAVADGMGGYQRGDVAAQLSCNVVKETVNSHRHMLELYRRHPNEATRSALKAMLDMAVQRACQEVHQAAVAITGEGGRMGTTLDVLLMVGSTAFIAHVGDGRIYLVRGGEIHQVTEDHTLVQQRLHEGVISPVEARRARTRNVITRALGVFPSVMVDALHFELSLGDKLLMCTDGLYRYVGVQEIGGVVTERVDGDTISRLIALANERGGRDNITAVICAIEPETSGELEGPTKRRMEVLRNVGLFQYCTYRELMRVYQSSEQRSIPAGTRLFQEGDLGRECYVIESGTVLIEKEGQHLARLEAGDYFGEMSFIDVPRRSADAVVEEAVELMVLKRHHFLQLLKSDSDLAAKLMWQLLQKLSGMVREANRLLVAADATEVRPLWSSGSPDEMGDTVLEEDE